MTLEDVLANHRGQAAVLRARGLGDRANDIELLCDDVAAAMTHYLSWLSEAEAALATGHSKAWLRARFEGFAARSDARKKGRARQYRQSALPQGADLRSAAARGRRLARGRVA